jgi:hypothetical protein
MKALIQDTCFPPGAKLRIGEGADELLFLRCFFEGGEIFVAQGIDRTVFSQCVFRGTSFSGQLLSERIATACRTAPPETEETAARMGSRTGRFRS